MLRVLRINQDTRLFYKTAQIFAIPVSLLCCSTSAENKVITMAQKSGANGL